eukprot:CAMPEP_0206379858 /NCGR_PEP_ID=MMETSP0294-20121207/11646_1 /ASSEMBLY_ACC=CAM_ASM_000327 /TAXON_ID=39354 /ORGANISM="Heterosigma akashiwo, Strain CCMP2393" /LENGTH=151 /DNA_ID=CAMNT_0053828891 /DNA_START=282 /DNA_END=738 /DNA_ORIENTATION=+
MVEKKALRCVNPNVPVMLPSASSLELQPARPLDKLSQKVRSAQHVLKAGRPANEVADRLRPKTSSLLASQQVMLYSLILITQHTLGSLLQVEPMEVGPKLAVARQELQNPNPQALVPHVGVQRLQARGEALGHTDGGSAKPALLHSLSHCP